MQLYHFQEMAPYLISFIRVLWSNWCSQKLNKIYVNAYDESIGFGLMF